MYVCIVLYKTIRLYCTVAYNQCYMMTTLWHGFYHITSQKEKISLHTPNSSKYDSWTSWIHEPSVNSLWVAIFHKVQVHLNADAFFQCTLGECFGDRMLPYILTSDPVLDLRRGNDSPSWPMFAGRWIPIQKACSKGPRERDKMLKSHFESQLRNWLSLFLLPYLAYSSAYLLVTSRASRYTQGIANRREDRRGKREKQEAATIILTQRQRTSYRYVPAITIWNLQHYYRPSLWDKPKFGNIHPFQ